METHTNELIRCYLRYIVRRVMVGSGVVEIDAKVWLGVVDGQTTLVEMLILIYRWRKENIQVERNKS